MIEREAYTVMVRWFASVTLRDDDEAQVLTSRQLLQQGTDASIIL